MKTTINIIIIIGVAFLLTGLVGVIIDGVRVYTTNEPNQVSGADEATNNEVMGALAGELLGEIKEINKQIQELETKIRFVQINKEDLVKIEDWQTAVYDIDKDIKAKNGLRIDNWSGELKTIVRELLVNK